MAAKFGCVLDKCGTVAGPVGSELFSAGLGKHGPNDPLHAATDVEQPTQPFIPQFTPSSTSDNPEAHSSAFGLPAKRSKTNPLKDRLRLTALQSGRQPRWSSEDQLIPDGFNDPSLHVEEAKALSFLGETTDALHDDLSSSAARLQQQGRSAIRLRLDALGLLRRRAVELEEEKDWMYANVSPSILKLFCKLHVPLMKWLAGQISVEDKVVPDL